MSGSKPLIHLQAKPFAMINLFFLLDQKEPKNQGLKEIFKRSSARCIKIWKLPASGGSNIQILAIALR
jgi:hypothetical protein